MGYRGSPLSLLFYDLRKQSEPNSKVHGR
jgi:hypothetical protein